MSLFNPKLAAVQGALRTKATKRGDVEIWRKGRQGRRKSKGGMQMDLIADRAWVVAMDALLLVEHVSNANAVNHSIAIEKGVDVETGQRRASPKRGGTRFNKTGKFWRSIRRRKISGNSQKARAMVDSRLVKGIGAQKLIAKSVDARRAGKESYGSVLVKEASRGHQYFSVKGQLDAVQRRATKQAAQAMLDGNSRPADRAMKKALAMRGMGK